MVVLWILGESKSGKSELAEAIFLFFQVKNFISVHCLGQING